MCLSMRERIARFIFTQVANGLEYLHDVAFVANRDLKLDNILFTTKEGGTNIYSHDRAQITDFTTAFKFTRSTANTVRVANRQGTTCYLAPEVFTLNDYAPKPLDVWALGVSLFAFMFGRLPFFGDTEHEMETSIRHDEIVFDASVPVSDQFKDVMRALLTKDPDLRPSVAEAKTRYEWLQRPDFPSERAPL